ncbi:hypothetical protein FOA52_014933 [Chlamydomonas sp. UWO 241]|nr:hypothetical protein FOA52_014933 [Chlamydomonas sp. UWO 241]
MHPTSATAQPEPAPPPRPLGATAQLLLPPSSSSAAAARLVASSPWDSGSGSFVGTTFEEDVDMEPDDSAHLMDLLARASPEAGTAVPRIHQASMTVQGLLKRENQDRVVTAINLRDLGAQTNPIASRKGAGSRQHNGSHSNGGIGRSSITLRSGSGKTPGVSYCAVFDGHGGTAACTLGSERLQHIIAGDDAFHEAFDAWLRGDFAGAENLQALWSSAFAALDAEILERSDASGHMDGSTVVAAVHAGACLVSVGAGDSRAVLSRHGRAVRLTTDHTPNKLSERTRIEAAGGSVRFLKGSWRVVLPDVSNMTAKICACSRCLGDADFKAKALITANPEATHTLLVPHADACSIFASDGVWAFMSDQAAAKKLITKALDAGSCDDISVIVNLHVTKALDVGSCDDISVIVNLYDWHPHPEPFTHPAPHPTPAAAKKLVTKALDAGSCDDISVIVNLHVTKALDVGSCDDISVIVNLYDWHPHPEPFTHPAPHPTPAAAKKLVTKALDAGSCDDISVIVNLYDWGPHAHEHGTLTHTTSEEDGVGSSSGSEDARQRRAQHERAARSRSARPRRELRRAAGVHAGLPVHPHSTTEDCSDSGMCGSSSSDSDY